MDKLRAMQWYVLLAELGSFTEVAARVGASKSMVSKELKQLEAQLGGRLLHRSTRELRLTEIGVSYLERCRKLLADLDEADALVAGLQAEPRGRLRVNAPMALGLTELAQVLVRFMAAHPQIQLDLHLTDEPLDLVQGGFDLGIRASSQVFNSDYVGKPIGSFRYRICATPTYLQTHPAINSAADLAQHNCFVYSYFRYKDYWPIGAGVRVGGQLVTNSTPFMLHAIKAHQGLGFLPEFVCRAELAAGVLSEVLPELERPLLTLYTLYPARRQVPPKTRALVDYLTHWFERGGADGTDTTKAGDTP